MIGERYERAQGRCAKRVRSKKTKPPFRLTPAHVKAVMEMTLVAMPRIECEMSKQLSNSEHSGCEVDLLSEKIS